MALCSAADDTTAVQVWDMRFARSPVSKCSPHAKVQRGEGRGCCCLSDCICVRVSVCLSVCLCV